MLKILQARLHQYMNYELPDVQAGFRKGRAVKPGRSTARSQIAYAGDIGTAYAPKQNQ